MSWDLAFVLGAALPRTVPEHRAMLHDERHLRIHVNGMAGLALFWELMPGLVVAQSS